MPRWGKGFIISNMQTSKKIKLAIFDIDGTIFRSSLLIELINGLVENGIFTKVALKEIQKEYIAWLDRKGTYDEYIKKVIAIHLKYIGEKNIVEVEAIARDTVEFLKNRTYRFTLKLIKELKKKKYFLITISGSPTYMVSDYAKILGFQASFGSEYEVRNGKFTGKILNLETFYKKDLVLKNFVKQKGLNVDWKNSIAVGDTESDASMLSLVGKPIAFNPNTGLLKIAQKKKWRIVVERKDVIYELGKFKIGRV